MRRDPGPLAKPVARSVLLAVTVNPAGIFCQTVAMGRVVECKLGGGTAGLVTYWLEKSWFYKFFQMA